jgi:hypothetical protein
MTQKERQNKVMIGFKVVAMIRGNLSVCVLCTKGITKADRLVGYPTQDM